MTVSGWILLGMRNVSNKSCRKIKIQILCSVIVSPKMCRLWDNVEKHDGAISRKCQYGGAFHAGLVRLHARKHTSALCTHTHKRAHARTHKYIIHCFSIATMGSGTRLSVTLCAHCLSCLLSLDAGLSTCSTGFQMRSIIDRERVSMSLQEPPVISLQSLCSLHVVLVRRGTLPSFLCWCRWHPDT